MRVKLLAGILLIIVFLHPSSAYPLDQNTYTNLEGKIISYSSYQGKYLFLNAFYTGCSYCIEFHATITELYAEYSNLLHFVSVAIYPEDTLNTVQEYVMTYGGDWDFGIDDGLLRETLNIKSTPTSFLLDNTGEVVEKWVGGPPKADVVYAIEFHINGNTDATSPTSDRPSFRNPDSWFEDFITNPITQFVLVFIVVIMIYRKVRA
ncbi:MAG: TlpA family protein disulfide reductase [Candidatus Heimdallarchaeota archaeon]|nr:TlpA family protein disulfide reductase [Candidatus Heimdallarchaeota archaeon]